MSSSLWQRESPKEVAQPISPRFTASAALLVLVALLAGRVCVLGQWDFTPVVPLWMQSCFVLWPSKLPYSSPFQSRENTAVTLQHTWPQLPTAVPFPTPALPAPLHPMPGVLYGQPKPCPASSPHPTSTTMDVTFQKCPCPWRVSLPHCPGLRHTSVACKRG